MREHEPGTSLGMESQAYRDQSRKLAELGFERIGASNLFQYGEFAISIDQSSGNLGIFVDYDLPREGEEILGIRKGLEWKNSLQFLKRSSQHGTYGIETTLEGSGGAISREAQKPKLEDFQGKPIDQQLLETGFTKDSGAMPGQDNAPTEIFRTTWTHDRGKSEIVAVVSDGKLVRLLKPVSESVERHLTPGTTVVDRAIRPNMFGYKNDTFLTLRNEQMEFIVDSGVGGMIEEGSQKVTREISAEELGVHPLDVVTEKGGFKIGGVNTSELIRGLPVINGQSVNELESRMRPRRDSDAGFLGAKERLLVVLAEDNDFVVAQGITHQDLAEPLKYARAFVRRDFGNNFKYRGHNYQIDLMSYRGLQESPFDDGTATNSDATITNLDNGEKLSLSLLVPDMIERYGFYEGKKTPYRVEPSQIIKVFPQISEKIKKE